MPYLLFLGLILFQSTGFFLAHSLQMAHARHEMKQVIKAGVADELQVVLKITKETENNSSVFKWHEKREFRYKGQMYDVLSRVKSGDTTWYTCIHDVKESGLFDRLEKMVEAFLSEDSEEKKQREFLLGFFQKMYWHSLYQLPSFLKSTHEPNSFYFGFFTDEPVRPFFRPPSFLKFS